MRDVTTSLGNQQVPLQYLNKAEAHITQTMEHCSSLLEQHNISRISFFKLQEFPEKLQTILGRLELIDLIVCSLGTMATNFYKTAAQDSFDYLLSKISSNPIASTTGVFPKVEINKLFHPTEIAGERLKHYISTPA